jgi:hypothetical protein
VIEAGPRPFDPEREHRNETGSRHHEDRTQRMTVRRAHVTPPGEQPARCCERSIVEDRQIVPGLCPIRQFVGSVDQLRFKHRGRILVARSTPAPQVSIRAERSRPARSPRSRS